MSQSSQNTNVNVAFVASVVVVVVVGCGKEESEPSTSCCCYKEGENIDWLRHLNENVSLKLIINNDQYFVVKEFRYLNISIYILDVCEI